MEWPSVKKLIDLCKLIMRYSQNVLNYFSILADITYAHINCIKNEKMMR